MYKFQYWPRYVSRVLKINAEYKGEYIGWKVEAAHEAKPTARDFEQCELRSYPMWRYSEQYPWNMANRLSSFPFPDEYYTIVYPNGKNYKSKLKFPDAEKAIIFKGDRVRILVGVDVGKNGIISSVIKLRDLVYVEGLNCVHLGKKGNSVNLRKIELPLNVTNEVSLLDPEDNEPCQAEWRFDELGTRVRVSIRSGRIIPIPEKAYSLDDSIVPHIAPVGDKDTIEAVVTKSTYQPHLRTFTADILHHSGNTDGRVRQKTYWY